MENVPNPYRMNASTTRKKKDPITARKLNKTIAVKILMMKPPRVSMARTTRVQVKNHDTDKSVRGF